MTSPAMVLLFPTAPPAPPLPRRVLNWNWRLSVRKSAVDCSKRVSPLSAFLGSRSATVKPFFEPLKETV